jgi:hypothetical protein
MVSSGLLRRVFLQEPHGVTTQKTPFFIAKGCLSKKEVANNQFSYESTTAEHMQLAQIPSDISNM